MGAKGRSSSFDPLWCSPFHHRYPHSRILNTEGIQEVGSSQVALQTWSCTDAGIHGYLQLHTCSREPGWFARDPRGIFPIPFLTRVTCLWRLTKYITWINNVFLVILHFPREPRPEFTISRANTLERGVLTICDSKMNVQPSLALPQTAAQPSGRNTRRNRPSRAARIRREEKWQQKVLARVQSMFYLFVFSLPFGLPL